MVVLQQSNVVPLSILLEVTSYSRFSCFCPKVMVDFYILASTKFLFALLSVHIDFQNWVIAGCFKKTKPQTDNSRHKNSLCNVYFCEIKQHKYQNYGYLTYQLLDSIELSIWQNNTYHYLVQYCCPAIILFLKFMLRPRLLYFLSIIVYDHGYDGAWSIVALIKYWVSKSGTFSAFDIVHM